MVVNWERFAADCHDDPGTIADRKGFLTSLKSYCTLRGVEVPWDDIEKMPDGELVNLLCAHLPLSPEDKQALIETVTTAERATLMRGLLDMVETQPSLQLRGLMCIAPNYEQVEQCRPLFRKMHEIYQRVKEIPYLTANITYLSMGMTHDYRIAVEEGANIVRVGTAIFGPRQY